MGRIFLTGDLHGPIEIRKLNSEFWPEGRTLTKDDILIILGDFGLLWDNSKEEQYWINWLGEKPWTTLVVWGNHENYDMISKLGTDTKFSAPVDLIRTSGGYIYGLKHGNIYTINDKTFFVMGGATSIDKQYRKEGVSWWPQEIPNDKDWENAYNNLEKVDYKVDYILTHACPGNFVRYVSGDIWNPKGRCPVSLKLNDIFDQCQFDSWFFGHMHQDGWVNRGYDGRKKMFALYESIHELKNISEDA